ncbi:MAG: histidine phosphatase family protein [Alphaproteobacteria bacterium]
MTRIALIRHGPTEWNEQHRLQGQTDVPLSVDGERKVDGWTLPAEFHDYDWVASPLTRAQQTAAALGLTPRPEPSLIEMDWGDWEGFTRDELIERYGDGFRERTAQGIDLRPHNGESPREVRARFAEWAAGVALSGRDTGAVAHQGIIRAALSLATGWIMMGKPPAKMDWSSVHLFAVDENGVVTIERLNVSLELK